MVDLLLKLSQSPQILPLFYQLNLGNILSLLLSFQYTQYFHQEYLHLKKPLSSLTFNGGAH
jgi:hypothetical protein